MIRRPKYLYVGGYARPSLREMRIIIYSCRNKGMTHSELASKVGISQTSLTNYYKSYSKEKVKKFQEKHGKDLSPVSKCLYPSLYTICMEGLDIRLIGPLNWRQTPGLQIIFSSYIITTLATKYKTVFSYGI